MNAVKMDEISKLHDGIEKDRVDMLKAVKKLVTLLDKQESLVDLDPIDEDTKVVLEELRFETISVQESIIKARDEFAEKVNAAVEQLKMLEDQEKKAQILLELERLCSGYTHFKLELDKCFDYSTSFEKTDCKKLVSVLERLYEYQLSFKELQFLVKCLE